MANKTEIVVRLSGAYGLAIVLGRCDRSYRKYSGGIRLFDTAAEELAGAV